MAHTKHHDNQRTQRTGIHQERPSETHLHRATAKTSAAVRSFKQPTFGIFFSLDVYVFSDLVTFQNF